MKATTIDYFNKKWNKTQKVKAGKCIFTAINDKTNKLINRCKEGPNGNWCATSTTKKHRFNINTGRREEYDAMKTYGFCEKNATKEQIKRIKYKFANYNSVIDFTATILFIYENYAYIYLISPNILYDREYKFADYYTGIDSSLKNINKHGLFKILLYKIRTRDYNPQQFDNIIGNIKFVWNKKPSKEHLKKNFTLWKHKKNEPVIFNIEFFNIKKKIVTPSPIEQYSYSLYSESNNSNASASASANARANASANAHTKFPLPLSYANITMKTKLDKTYIIFVQGHGSQLKSKEFDEPVRHKKFNSTYTSLSHLLKKRVNLSKLQNNKNKIRVLFTQNIGSLSYNSIIIFLIDLLHKDPTFLKLFINSKTKQDLLKIDNILTKYYYSINKIYYQKKYDTITKFHHYPNVRNIGPPNLNINFYPNNNDKFPFGIMRYNYNDIEDDENAFTEEESDNTIEYIPRLFYGYSNIFMMPNLEHPFFEINNIIDYLTRIRYALRIPENPEEKYKKIQKQLPFNQLLYKEHERKYSLGHSSIFFSISEIIHLIDTNENLNDDEEILIVFNMCRYIDVSEIQNKDINTYYNIQRRNIIKQPRVHSKKRKNIYKMRQLSNNAQNPNKLL
jgi:hypothetical protein